jgi:hypothetical protein
MCRFIPALSVPKLPKLPRKKQGIDILSTYLLLGLLPERPPAVYFSVMMLASLEFRRLSGAYPG